jgi:hypothetical protein
MYGKVKMNLTEKWESIEKVLSFNCVDEETHEKLEEIEKRLCSRGEYFNLKSSYNFSFKAQKSERTWGRMYSTGLQSMPNIVRSTCSSNFYYDVDMSNSAPRIFLSVLKKFNLPHENLERYIDNREYYLSCDPAISRGEAKDNYIKAIYVKNIESKNENLRKVSEEMNHAKNALFETPEFKEEKHFAEVESEFSYKIKNRFWYLLMTRIESKILNLIVKLFQEEKISVGTMIFDGILVEKKNLNRFKLNSLMKKIEQQVDTKLGVNISLCSKNMAPKFDIKRCNPMKFLDCENVLTIDERYISSIVISEQLKQFDVVCVVSPMGSGKTTAVCELLSERDVIFVSYRRTLGNQFVSSMAKQNKEVFNYNKILKSSGKAKMKEKINFNKSEKRCVQFDSIKFIDLETVNKNTVIYLDECSALCEYISSSPTFSSRRNELYCYFSTLIKKAGKILITDADLDKKTLNFIKKLRNEDPVSCIRNTNVQDKNLTVNFVEENHEIQENQTMQLLIQKLNEGENVIVPCDSLAMLKTIKQTITNSCEKEIKSIYYSSESGFTEELEKGADKVWNDLSVFFTPSITTGLDYNAEARHVFAFYTGKSVSYKTFIQMVERTRKKKSLTISYSAADRKYLFKSEVQYKKHIKENISFMCNLNKEISDIIRMNQYGEMEISDDPFSVLTLKCYTQKNKDRNYCITKMENKLKKMGYKTAKIREVEKTGLNIHIQDGKQADVKQIERVREHFINKTEPVDKTIKDLKNNIQRKIDLINVSTKEAIEEDYIWQLVTDNKKLTQHFRLKNYLKTIPEIKEKLKDNIKNKGSLHILNDDTVKCNLVQYFETMLEVNVHEDENILKNQVKKNKNCKITLLPGIGDYCKCDIKDKNEDWEKVYIQLSKYHRNYLKGFVETKRFQTTDDTIKYTFKNKAFISSFDLLFPPLKVYPDPEIL